MRAVQPKPPTTIDLFHVAPIRASVAEALMELLDVLPSLGRVTFAQLTEAIHDRIEVVCRFLAILELYKQGRVDLEQSDKFGDIQVLWTGGNDIGFEAVFNIDDYEG
jgi:segregation and condensation protein A